MADVAQCYMALTVAAFLQAGPTEWPAWRLAASFFRSLWCGGYITLEVRYLLASTCVGE